MNKIRILSFLRPLKNDELYRKVKTVDNIPKILTIVSTSLHHHKHNEYNEKNPIKEEEEDDLMVANQRSPESKDPFGSSDSDDSSIDYNEDDEEGLY
jgi:hypothetical protein